MRAQLHILMMGENSPIVSRSQGVTFLPGVFVLNAADALRCPQLRRSPAPGEEGQGP